MNSTEIRKKFFDFFIKNKHTQVPSSSLIPAQDPTILFTNAGMNQFKDLFLGLETRSYKKAVSIQKCIRAGGKHNDLENVGFTKRHLTFFEMMGNFSFGDYFKKDAIIFAWDFLTKEIKLDKDKLYASVYKEDQEAYDIWHKEINLPQEKIVKLGAEDNFWQMGDTGPCGPCSEIYFDRGPKNNSCDNKNCAPGCSCDRFIEIWNLVFMQFDRQADGSLKPLKQTGVDTGMGLERLCTVVQNKDSVFDIDIFEPIITKIEELTSYNFATADNNIKAAFRVLSDHIRSSCFAIADGCTPSNEGRGYVLRKIIRRAALFAQKLNNKKNSKNIFPQIAPALIDSMSNIYPELKINSKQIISLLTSETEKFAQNLISGKEILEKYMQENISSKIITGSQAFKLYDTYGFPLELTKVIAQENNFKVDLENFEKEMEKQKLQSGKKITDMAYELTEDFNTIFTGYETHETTANITAILLDNKEVKEVPANSDIAIITDKSPFYVECGGQISDQGLVIINNKETQLLALKKINNSIAAFIKTPVNLKVGDKVILKVDSPSRINTMKNHTATHLLQAALISLLGKNIKQSGSVVTPDYLRFDFTYHENLSTEQINEIEELVNKKILENIPVNISQTTYKDAVSKGVIAFFGEKYNPEKVRVIEIPGFSAELCGGTHVRATGDIGCFKITEMSALSAGNRRIVALTGPQALKLFQEDFNIIKLLGQEFKVTSKEIISSVLKQKEQLKLASTQIKDLKKQLNKYLLPEYLNKFENLNSIKFGYLEINADSQELREIATNLVTQNKQDKVFCFLFSKTDNKISFVITWANININTQNLAKFLKDNNLSGGGSGNSITGGAQEIKADFKDKLKNWVIGNSQ